jgi:hypothetical protein
MDPKQFEEFMLAFNAMIKSMDALTTKLDTIVTLITTAFSQTGQPGTKDLFQQLNEKVMIANFVETYGQKKVDDWLTEIAAVKP